MKNSVLDGARAKIERAMDHLTQIDIAVGQMLIDDRDKAVSAIPTHEYKPDSQELIVTRPHSTPLNPTLPRWSVIASTMPVPPSTTWSINWLF
jgi:hypothetical protein